MRIHRISMMFSHIKLNAPAIDLSRYYKRSPGWEEDCKILADSFHRFGLVYVKDDQLNYEYNNHFLDLMERYFTKRSQQYDEGIRDLDVDNSHIALGLKHIYHEKFTSYEEKKRSLKEPHLSQTPIHPKQKDPTWRFHAILGYRDNVVPKDFPNFVQTFSNWGYGMKKVGLTVAEMAALGMGLQKDAISSKMINADFYQSPPGADLNKSKLGDVITSFHHDFDLLTLHGKSRFPGLYAWLNTDQKFLVEIPEGYLLIQSGKQLEWYTGGYIKAGYHQVIHNEKVEENKQAAIKAGRPAWRIASTMFCQCESTQILKPFTKFQTPQTMRDYPQRTADDYLTEHLNIITKGEH